MARKLVLFFFLLMLAVVGAILYLYLSIPTSNTTLTHFDTLIVLGFPCNIDGTPSIEQRERVLEAVREFQRGTAPHIIMSGGKTDGQNIEADCMTRFAVSKGVPADAILEEAQARNTLQNIRFSDEIMRAHQWTSAEVISSPSHLPRAGLILQHYHVAWRTHPGLWAPEYDRLHILYRYIYEIRNCTDIRLFGFPRDAFPR